MEGLYLSESQFATAENFSNVLAESIDEGLKRLLGEGGVKAVLNYLRSVQLDNPRELHIKLSSIFGKGTEILEKAVVKELYRKLNLSYEEGAFDFERCINHAKILFLVDRIDL